jgi:predicted O-linked N-acetylglucosamine transferase (SPINDLY family)
MTLEQGLNTAVSLQQAGRLEDAERLYRQILAQQPDCADGLHLLGVLCAQRGRGPEALDLIRKAISLHPDVAGYHINLGNILLVCGNAEEAVAEYRRAIGLQPGSVVSHNGLGNAFSQLRRFDDAIQSYRTALSIQPNLADAWSNLGNALREKHEYAEAIDAAKKALAIRPDFPEAISVLGNALRESGRTDEAIDQYHKAIALHPAMPEVYINLALALETRRLFDEALAAIDKALELRPNWALAWSNRAKTLRDQGNLEEAIASARCAIAISPDLAEAQINLAGSLMDSGDIDGALEAVKRALELGPEIPATHNVAANVFKEAGDIPRAIAALDCATELQKDDASIHSNKVYLLEYDPRCDAAGLLAEQRRWNDRHARPLEKLIRLHENDRSPDRRLRIGYVSPYFRDHAQAFFLVPLLESHDRERFEVYCYSDTNHPDPITQRTKNCADVWRETAGLSPQELADQIRSDGIDILVDLVLHMALNRARTFAQKPAPVQVAWLAYPGGTGMDAMDYRITDAYLDPPGVDDAYRERSIRLPDTFWCYNPLRNEPPVNAPPSLEKGFITFGCLNNFCKVDEQVLQLWARVLKAVDGSRMMIQCPDGSCRQSLFDLMQCEGIHRDRIELISRCSRSKYLELYHRIDVGLDTFPYNGHTTSLDSFWMGVPVITLIGKRVVGRAGLSQLTNLSLTELVSHTPEQYVQTAADLAGDLPRLTELRRTLRPRLAASPLMDGPRFARNMEAAYRRMWTDWCAGKIN